VTRRDGDVFRFSCVFPHSSRRVVEAPLIFFFPSRLFDQPLQHAWTLSTFFFSFVVLRTHPPWIISNRYPPSLLPYLGSPRPGAFFIGPITGPRASSRPRRSLFATAFLASLCFDDGSQWLLKSSAVFLSFLRNVFSQLASPLFWHQARAQCASLRKLDLYLFCVFLVD